VFCAKAVVNQEKGGKTYPGPKVFKENVTTVMVLKRDRKFEEKK